MAALKRVVAIVGSGGVGIASARRLAGGRTLLLADASNERLQSALSTLRKEGYEPSGHILDVTNSSAVEQFAKQAAEEGPLDVVVHTAGVNPVSFSAKQIYDINLVGTANVIDAFQPHVGVGTSMICVASMAGHLAMGSISAALQKHFALSPISSLLTHQELSNNVEPGMAYTIAKAANILRVQAAAKAYGDQGARINSVSPGIIYTVMGKDELEGPTGHMIKAMVDASAMKRVGTGDDVSKVVAFLAGPESAYVTGSDILVDGLLSFETRTSALLTLFQVDKRLRRNGFSLSFYLRLRSNVYVEGVDDGLIRM